MLAESASSPLPALTSSPVPFFHSLPADHDHEGSSEHQSDYSDGSEKHDPSYHPQSNVAFTTTSTPLKNKPFAHRSISTSSATNLVNHGHKPNVCILTRQAKNTGIPITRPHMIPQATKPKDVSREQVSFLLYHCWNVILCAVEVFWMVTWLWGRNIPPWFALQSYFQCVCYHLSISLLFTYSSYGQCPKTGTLCLMRGSGRWCQ